MRGTKAKGGQGKGNLKNLKEATYLEITIFRLYTIFMKTRLIKKEVKLL